MISYALIVVFVLLFVLLLLFCLFLPAFLRHSRPQSKCCKIKTV